ncbi:MAG TPA: DUF5011 domain-containing protein [Planctomycetota bacterium]|nr:DUF5011 domain-containing protein [Planctomycetota bacterium]
MSDVAGNWFFDVLYFGVSSGAPPYLVLNGPSDMSMDLNGTFIDPGATAYDECDLDINSRIVVTGAVDPTTLGDYTLTYDVTNYWGESAPYSVSRVVHVKVDGTPPALTIIGPPNGFWSKDNNPVISGTIEDDGSGIDFVVVSIDGFELPFEDGDGIVVDEYNADNSVKKLTFRCWVDPNIWPDHAALSEGPHTITVVALDNAGNQLYSTDWKVNVDVTAPAVTCLDPGAGGTVYQGTFQFMCQLSDDLSGISRQSLSVKIDGSDVSADDITLFDWGVLLVQTHELSTGEHSIIVSLNDSAGDWTDSNIVGNNSANTFLFNVDRTLFCYVVPAYGTLPLTWSAIAIRDSEDVTAQCTFNWSSILAQIEPNGEACVIPSPSSAGYWQINVSASMGIGGEPTINSAVVSADLQIPDDGGGNGTEGDDGGGGGGGWPNDSTMEVKSVEFIGIQNVKVFNYTTKCDGGDGSKPYDTPEWTKDRSNPICYSVNAPLKLNVTITVTPNSTPARFAHLKVKRGTDSDECTILLKGGDNKISDVDCANIKVNEAITKKTPLNLEYQVAFNNRDKPLEWQTVGNSTNDLFVVLDRPKDSTQKPTYARLKWCTDHGDGKSNASDYAAKIHSDLCLLFNLDHYKEGHSWEVCDGTKADCGELSLCMLNCCNMIGITGATTKYANCSSDKNVDDVETSQKPNGTQTFLRAFSAGSSTPGEWSCVLNGTFYPGGVPGEYDSGLAVLRAWLTGSSWVQYFAWLRDGTGGTGEPPAEWVKYGNPVPVP